MEPTARVEFVLDAEQQACYEQALGMLRSLYGQDRPERWGLAVMARHFLNMCADADRESVPEKRRRMISRGKNYLRIPGLAARTMRTQLAEGRMQQGGLVKIFFDLEPGAWHGHVTESLWAERIGDGRYRLRNVPFHVKGVSAEDIVFADVDDDRRLSFRGISIRSGHSTYRVLLTSERDQKAFQALWEPLQKLGCTHETADEKLLAIDVPPGADIYTVYALLERGEALGVWDFEEGHCGHPLRT